MNDDDLKAKEERLKAKLERIEEMFPNPTPAEARQIEAAKQKAQAQLAELQKQISGTEEK